MAEDDISPYGVELTVIGILHKANFGVTLNFDRLKPFVVHSHQSTKLTSFIMKFTTLAFVSLIGLAAANPLFAKGQFIAFCNDFVTDANIAQLISVRLRHLPCSLKVSSTGKSTLIENC
jgi:hypothetical protein